MEKDFNSIIGFIKQNKLFNMLTEDQQKQIAEMATIVTLDRGEYLIREGEAATDIFIIMEGEVEIIKKEPGTNRSHRIATLGKGNSIGEVSLLDSCPRSASVVGLKSSVLLKLSINELMGLSSSEQSIHVKMSLTLAQEMGRRLRETNETAVELLHREIDILHERLKLGRFIGNFLLIIICYIFLLSVSSRFITISHTSFILSIIFISILTCAILIYIKLHHLPYKNFGLTLKGWRKAIYEGIIYSFPILFIIAVIKWICVNYITTFKGLPIFSLGAEINNSPTLVIATIIGYIIFAPMQEFIVRGSLQNMLFNFFQTPYKKWLTIFLANLVYAISYLILPLGLILVIFLLGLFWGWLFSRHKSLLSVAISHSLIGIFLFYIIGFEPVLYLGFF